ncbi:MAG: hypothetical protein HQL26_07240 [Candidatus Omnitrophica bacterium]|nr:hypothetical protein [Candidatus Omnitrophota bacterium]
MFNELKKQHILIVLLAGMICLTCAGCETLKKKFVRSKKEAQENTVEPILDPVDYPAKVVSAREQYLHYYSLYQVWSKEMTQNFEGGMDLKRQKYLCSQIIQQLIAMKDLLSAPKKDGLGGVIVKLEKNIAQLDDPIAMSNIHSVEMNFERNFRAIREGYKPKDVEKFYHAAVH